MYESQREDPWQSTVGSVARGTAPETYPGERYTWSYAAPSYATTPQVGEHLTAPSTTTPLWYTEPAPNAGPETDITGTTPPVIYPMRNRAGTAALVLGIIGLLCTSIAFVLFPLGIIAGLWAIVLGRRGRFRARYGFASNGSAACTGLSLGIIAVVLGALLSAGTYWVASTYGFEKFGDCASGSADTAAALRCVADVISAN